MGFASNYAKFRSEATNRFADLVKTLGKLSFFFQNEQAFTEELRHHLRPEKANFVAHVGCMRNLIN